MSSSTLVAVICFGGSVVFGLTAMATSDKTTERSCAVVSVLAFVYALIALLFF